MRIRPGKEFVCVRVPRVVNRVAPRRDPDGAPTGMA